MVSGNVPFERELIEQCSLFDLPMSHHDSKSCLSQRLNQRTLGVATANFFNRIDPKQTSRKADRKKKRRLCCQSISGWASCHQAPAREALALPGDRGTRSPAAKLFRRTAESSVAGTG